MIREDARGRRAVIVADYLVNPGSAFYAAIPRRPGLTGFFSTKDSGTRYNPKGPAGKGDKQIVGPQSCPDFK